MATQDDVTVVLAVGAHPDDIEEFCGGTLVLLARRGVPVHMACLTGGEAGIAGASIEEARRIRLAEAARSAEIAGAVSFHHLGLRDLQFEPEAEAQALRELVRLIRRLRANLIIAHADGDYHSDHRVVHRLATQARIAASVENVDAEPPLPRDPDLVFMDTEGGVAFEPHIWIDVSEVIDVRRRMLGAHASQATFLHGQELADVAERLARFRGLQRGCAYAEAFRGCAMWPYPDGGIRRLVKLLDE